jgi:hypothetical protein
MKLARPTRSRASDPPGFGAHALEAGRPLGHAGHVIPDWSTYGAAPADAGSEVVGTHTRGRGLASRGEGLRKALVY